MGGSKLFLCGDQVFGRNCYMDVFRTFRIGLSQVDLLEVMYSNLQVATQNLNVDDDFFISCTCDCISILFVGRKRIRDHATGCELKLSEFGLRVQDYFSLLFDGEFDQEDALGTRFLRQCSHFIGYLSAFLCPLGKIFKAFRHFVFRLAKFGVVVGETLVSCDLQVDFLTVVHVVEDFLAGSLEGGRRVNR